MTTRRAAKKAVQSTDGRALPTLPARARVAGTHSTARELLAACAQLLAGLEIVAGEPALPLDDDYAQVEMALDRAPAPPALPVEPEPDTSYAGLSPDQRAALRQGFAEGRRALRDQGFQASTRRRKSSRRFTQNSGMS